MTAPLLAVITRYRTRLAACQRPRAGHCVLVVAAMAVALPLVASAQRMDASIGVSLTVLPLAPSQTLAVTELRIDRDGLATIQLTEPTAAPAPQLVMTRVSSSANGFRPTRYVSAPSRADRASEWAARGSRYRVDVGGAAESDTPRDVQLRIEYLIIAGT